MGEVLAAEQRIAIQRGATAFVRARKYEEKRNGEPSPKL
jgi:hypothetical protein